MNVRDVMSASVATILPDASVAEVARTMLEDHLEGIPVVDASGTLLGMVTAADLVAKHANVHLPIYFAILGTVLPIERHRTEEDMRRVLATTAGDLMETDIPTVSPADRVDDAATLMVDRHVNPLPVLEDGRLVGLIGHRDIIRILLMEEGDASRAPTGS